MILSHFKMNQLPFQETIPLDKLLIDDRFAKAIDHLEYFAAHGLAAVLTGATGSGKTCLSKRFLSHLPPHRYQPIYIHNTQVPTSAMLRMIVSAIGEQPSMGKDRLFRQIQERSAKSEQTMVLVIDEAHLLNESALTDLRLLISSPYQQQPPIKLLLSGQPTLTKILSRCALSDLAGRICVHPRLHPMSRDQSSSYIDHRLAIVGVSTQIFDPEAKSLIHDHSGGFPRQINSLATACLILAASAKSSRIDQHIVRQAAKETIL